ncbi:cache domain-containing protein [Paracoccus zhejiangensis]|uniref:histidine kinase n=1 Tax=Paracoccus zhejiangensis TaxID=1077935 RepID=A0A2H5F0F5_9RHOB|nr:cache domain-containing protein [Paracoccus zhejiangensis]AUH65024.1 histidine kinase [Paracoccus zhejiangensis]
MRNSLAALLALGLAGLQFIAVLAVVLSSYLTSERTLLDHARSLLTDVGYNATEHTKGFLDPARSAAELAARLAQHRVVASDDPALLEQFLFQQLRVTPNFSGLYYGDENGTFVMIMRTETPGRFRSKIILTQPERSVQFIWRNEDFSAVDSKMDPADQFDPRTRPWYQRAAETRGTIWTDPYIFFSAKAPGITLASPVFSSRGAIRGVVGVDIEISSISNFLSRLRIGTSGKALMINQNGDVIAHPNQDLIQTENSDGSLRFTQIDEIKDPIARTAFGSTGLNVADGKTRRATFSEITYGDARYVASVMPVISEELPWTIAVYAPEDDFTGAIKKNRATNIWIAALVAIVTGLIGLALAQFIHRPVRAFAVRSALISQGEIDPSEPMPKTYSELAEANASLVRQIVERKKTEREYGLTFDRSSRGMAQIAPESGRFLKVNSTFSDMTGYSAEELAAMDYADLAPPEDAGLLRPLTPMQDEDFATHREARLIRKDGDAISVTVNAILIRDHNGQPLHAVVAFDDITETKVKEGQIARLNRDLSHLARGETMGELAAGLAHEVNQPLAAIAQNADTALLVLDQAKDSPPELREILTEIEKQSLRAGEIIRALRGFIRKEEVTTDPFDLSELVEQTRILVQPEATEAGVALHTILPPLPPVAANRVQIAQVLVNLMRNAIEAMQKSDPTLRQVTVAARQIGGQIEVSVTDTGPGVDPAISLFTKFETTKSTGMGLGLSICRSLIEANGGKLWLDHDHSAGARFCFTLPVRAA